MKNNMFILVVFLVCFEIHLQMIILCKWDDQNTARLGDLRLDDTIWEWAAAAHCFIFIHFIYRRIGGGNELLYTH